MYNNRTRITHSLYVTLALKEDTFLNNNSDKLSYIKFRNETRRSVTLA